MGCAAKLFEKGITSIISVLNRVNIFTRTSLFLPVYNFLYQVLAKGTVEVGIHDSKTLIY